MKVWFAQIYIEPGVSFPFSHLFQRYLSNEITALVQPSEKFLELYGRDFNLIFRISAKRGISSNEIKGPTVFKRAQDVEYTVFLPFDVINRATESGKAALELLLAGARCILESLDIDTSSILEKQKSLIAHICSDPAMFGRKK